MKKLTYLQFLISRIQKKKILTALEEKLMQKLEEKLEELDSRLSTHCRLSMYSRLSRCRLSTQKAHNEAQMCA